MIYTVTFNPSLDYVVRVKRFVSGDINRAEEERIYPGGKGINVALMLGNLGIPAKMLGFVAGFTGQEIERLCRVNGGDCDFIRLTEGNSRINVKISAASETAVNGMGPHLPASALDALTERLQRLQDGDTLVLAGSIPADIPVDIYEQILKGLSGRPIRTVVDATGDLLKKVLNYHPFLIKPNQAELGELFALELHRDEEVVLCARRLQAMGACNVLVSLGSKGALLLGEDKKVYRLSAAAGTLVNSFGSGDSMVAGFLAGYERYDGDLQKALQLGISAGSASAFRPWLAEKEDVMRLFSLQLNKERR